MCKFSFVIPVYNAEKSIKKCIDSILSQTYKNIEIICVNDGSTDSSFDILNKIREKDKRVKIINQENQGAFLARKNGILSSCGDYIMFADSDDRFCDVNACIKILSVFENNDVQLVQFSHKVFNGLFLRKANMNRIGIITLEEIKVNYYKDIVSSDSDNVFFPMLWNKAFNGKILRDAVKDKVITLKMGEDYYLNLLFLSNSSFNAMYNIDECFYVYYSGVGCSSRFSGSILQEYGILKKYQMELCYKWNLAESAKYSCNMESIYYLLVNVKTMIFEKYDKSEVLDYIEKSKSYSCIVMAKKVLNNISDKYMYEELRFLISDYSSEEYYEYALKKANNISPRDKMIRMIKKFLKAT